MEELKITSSDNILILAPHPDDECIGPGGILCLFPKQCTVVVITNGELGQGKMTANETSKIRKEEFISEMQFAGVKNYYMLNIPDGQLMNHLEYLNELELNTYTKIFVTGMKDNHVDHTAAFVGLNNIVKQQGLDVEIFCYEIHSPLSNPTHFLDISDHVETKLNLIRKHKSQVSVYPYDDYAYYSAIYRGLLLRRPGKLFEVYQKISINSKISISDEEMELQKFKQFYRVLTRWIELKNSGGSIISKLTKYKTVSIYGYAELGKLLEQEINDSRLELLYIFDRKKAGEGKIITPEEVNKKPDCIIVTAVSAFEKIKNELAELGYDNVISLEELV